MSSRKRPADSTSSPLPPTKKRKQSQSKQRGFIVGPDNLPDGTYKRRVQKIKQSLIHRAKVRKEYAKALEQQPDVHMGNRAVQDEHDVDAARTPPNGAPKLHPERQQLLDQPWSIRSSSPTSTEKQLWKRRERRRPRKTVRTDAIWKEQQKAREEKQHAREAREKERQQKLEERERTRKAMGKARASGERKLGRESKVLLERVKKLMET